MVTTEKMTININVVDLGNIDLLVSEGFYSNRTDFIKTAIRNEILAHKREIEEIVVKKQYYVGIRILKKEELEESLKNKQKLDIRVVGMLILEDSITYDMVERAIASINVAGIVRCSPKLRIHFQKNI